MKMNEDSCTITSSDPGCLKGNHQPLGGHVLRPPTSGAAGCRTGQGVPGLEHGDRGGAGALRGVTMPGEQLQGKERSWLPGSSFAA